MHRVSPYLTVARSHLANNSLPQDEVTGRVWTPPLLQALCLITIRYDCLRVSGLYNDALYMSIGP